MSTANTKKKHIIRNVLIIFLVLCIGGLCGFSLSGTGQNTIQDAFGSIVHANKINATKQITLNGKNSGTLTYEETMNIKDSPVNSRSDNYGTYDVYNDTSGNEYIFLYNSDLLCGYKADYSTKETPASPGAIISQENAKNKADAYISSVFGKDSRQYTYKDMELTQDYIYYVNYSSFLNGIKTDDDCVVWVCAADGSIYAWHAFSRGRYDGYTGKNLSLSGSHEKLQTALPFLQSTDYEIGDQYITLSDNGTLMLHYDIFYTQGGITIPHTFETPVA